MAKRQIYRLMRIKRTTLGNVMIFFSSALVLTLGINTLSVHLFLYNLLYTLEGDLRLTAPVLFFMFGLTGYFIDSVFRIYRVPVTINSKED